MNVEKLHRDIIDFFVTCKIKETSFEFNGKAPYRKISLNEYYSKNIIETIISCLFQKGFDNLKNDIPFDIIKDEIEIDKIVYEYGGRLKQELEKLSFKINSRKTLTVSTLEKRNDNTNLSDYEEQVKTYMDYDDFEILIETEIKNGILKIETIKQEIKQKFREIKSVEDSDFKIDQDIIDKFLSNIFLDLKKSNHFDGNIIDFEKLMSGIRPSNKIGIKEITSMGTFINWLISMNLIPQKSDKKVDWKFIAQNLYITGSSKKLESSQFSKNASRNHNQEIYSTLKKHEAVIKSYISQHK